MAAGLLLWFPEGIVAWDCVRVLLDQHRVYPFFLLLVDCRRDVSWHGWHGGMEMNLDRGSATRCMNCFLDFAEFHWSNFERENANLPLRDYSVTYRPDLYPRGVYVRPQKLICKPWLINHVSSSYCLVVFNPSSLLKGWYSVCIISLPVLNSNAQLYYVLFAGLDFTFSICLPFVVLKLSL